MLGWFHPKLPVTPEQKAWVDSRAAWLLEQFGADGARDAPVILPTPEFFPDPFHGREEDVEPVLRRVCSYIGVDRGRIELFCYTDDDPDLGPGFHVGGERDRAAGLHVGGQIIRIGVEQTQIQDPMALIATLAHELGHVLLLDDGRISKDVEDHEPLTDLLTVFRGMGIFGANASVHDSTWRGGGWTGWRVGRLGYLSQATWGYALAVFAHCRGERYPVWARHLRPDLRAALKSSLQCLARS